MAYMEPKFLAQRASGDLSAKQFHFVKAHSVLDEAIIAAAGERALGVVMNLVAAAGDVVEVAVDGGAKVKLAGTVARGGEIMPNAAGAGVAATATNYVSAVALEAGVSGDVIPVILCKYKI